VWETSIAKWKEQFVEGGKAGLAAGQRRGLGGREARLAGEVDEFTRALGEAHVELRLLRRNGAALPSTASWR
jgi:transposase